MDFKKIEHSVYIIKCSDDTVYTGYAKNLYKRLTQHNEKKGAKYTKGRTPITLLYFEEFSNRSYAQKKECEIKKLKRIEKENYIKENLTQEKEKIILKINENL